MLVILAPGTVLTLAHAEEYFNPAFLETGGGKTTADLSVFNNTNSQPAGTYLVDISVNNEMMTSHPRNINFTKDADGKLTPCVTPEELKQWGIRTASFPGLGENPELCANIRAIPGAFSDFLFNQQRLNLSIPQIAMNTRSRDAVPEELWNEGIPAILMNYSVNGYKSRLKGGYTYDSTYVNLRPGLNFGPWRLRNYTTWRHNNPGSTEWDSVYSYLQRNIVTLRSQLTVGDSTAPSYVYDSVPFRGIQLKSDDDMLPSSIHNYAPVVRGVARSDALVTVSQNGYVVYETTVAPGAFEISDLASTGSAGDLEVTVKEADGSEQHMSLPYASLPVLQREGRFKYSFTGGQYRSYDSRTDRTPFVQGTGVYGLPWEMTVYGGLQNAGYKYQSFALGMGKNIGNWGAFSADVIHSVAIPAEESREQGQSYRVRYSKNFLDTGTNFSIAGYRYSTTGFRSLEETLSTYRSGSTPLYPIAHRRNRAEVSVGQDLGSDLGSFNFSLVREDYWREACRSLSVNMSYFKHFNNIGLSVNYLLNRNSVIKGRDISDKVLSLEVSVPLDTLLGGSYFSYGSAHTRGEGSRHNIGISGTSLKDNNLNWGINAIQTEHGGQSAGGNASWKTRYGTVNGSYSHSRDNQQAGYGMAGGVVIHEDGVTLSQQLGETVGLVKAREARNVNISNYPGISTDGRGYAVVPYLIPYKRNNLLLDRKSLQENADIAYASQKVVPTRGAVVRAEYQTFVGYRVLMTLTQENGNVLPFGTIVTHISKSRSDNTQPTSIVGDGGEVYISGMPVEGEVKAQWSNGHEKSCTARYIARKSEDNSGLWRAIGVCK